MPIYRFASIVAVVVLLLTSVGDTLGA